MSQRNAADTPDTAADQSRQSRLEELRRNPDPTPEDRYEDAGNEAPPNPRAPGGEEEQGDDAPAPKVELSPEERRRQDMADRFSKRRAEESPGIPFEQADPNGVPGVAREEARREAERQEPEDQGTGGDQGYTIKVRGKEMKVDNLDDLRALTGADDDEIDGLGPKALVRLAQLHQASLSYLDESRSGARESRRSPQDEGQHPGPESRQDPDAPNPDEVPTPDQEADDQFAATMQSMLYDDPDVARKNFESLVAASLSKAATTRQKELAIQAIDTDVTQKVTSFQEDPVNADLMGKESRLVFYSQITVPSVVRKYLIEAGLDAGKVNEHVQNLQFSVDAYRAARASGLKVPPVERILEEAAATAREEFNLPAPVVTRPGDRTPRTLPSNERRDVKRERLPEQPRTGGYQPQEALSDKGAAVDRAAAFREMKRMRGQGRPVQ